MTEAEVRAILARAEAATPGPWQRHVDGCGQVWAQEFPVAYCDTGYLSEGFTKTQWNLNAAFIAAARADVPVLAREVLALREALAAVCDWHTWPEVTGAFGFVAAHGITVAPQISEKAGAIWAQAQALLAEEEEPCPS